MTNPPDHYIVELLNHAEKHAIRVKPKKTRVAIMQLIAAIRAMDNIDDTAP